MEVVLLILVFTSLLREGSLHFADLLVSQNNFTWEDASKYCRTLNGRLLVLDSQEKWNYFIVHDKYKSNNLKAGRYWTGLQFDDTVHCDTTKKYTPWVYDGWGRWSHMHSEPNGCREQRCVRLQDNWMRTLMCNVYMKAICETGWSVPMPSTTFETNFETTFDPRVVTNTSASDANATCDKCCLKATYSRQLDQHEREQIKHSLKVQLAVNKTDLSAQRRKLISVHDSRPSSVAVGGLACVILVVVVGSVVVPDIISLGTYVFKHFKSVIALKIQRKLMSSEKCETYLNFSIIASIMTIAAR